MNVRFIALALQFRSSREVIEFGEQVSFFHGRVGTGKSSIARLIDYCLGGNNIQSPALQQEFVSAELTARLGENDVVLRRAKGSPSGIEVTWRGAAGEGAAEAPIQPGPNPPPLIEGTELFNLSDLLFHLLGTEPVKVRKNKSDPDAPLIRLGFRDFLKFCYLDQRHLDSTFYRLDSEGGMQVGKSRDVMRVVLGYYDARLSRFEQELEETRREALGKQAAAEQVLKFLTDQGLESAEQIGGRREQLETRLADTLQQLSKVQEKHAAETHFSETLKQRVRAAQQKVGIVQQAQADVVRTIADQQQLHAELVSAKFKLARSEVATMVLADAPFVGCPNCGQGLDRPVGHDHCRVCTQPVGGDGEEAEIREEYLSKDIAGQLQELHESIGRHQDAARQLQREFDAAEHTRAELDEQLRSELERFDSSYLSQARNLEREDARLRGALEHLDQLAALPEAANRMRREADQLQGKIAELRSDIAKARERLEKSNHHIGELEEDFKQALLAIGFPGVTEDDSIRIDRRNWMPYVQTDGDEGREWTFENVHSGGKSTLFNVCFGLALHRTASELALPLPTFMIIDSPMKNIDPEVNEDLFVGFYRYLFQLMASSLRNTQVIIMDSKHVTAPDDLKVFERYMTLDDPEHPPLIPGYTGP